MKKSLSDLETLPKTIDEFRKSLKQEIQDTNDLIDELLGKAEYKNTSQEKQIELRTLRMVQYWVSEIK